jgi:hypothetical protein
VTPPIPARLVNRPTVGGLVVPWISVSDGTHHALGQVHHNRAAICFRDHLCQLDGEPLVGRRVVLVTGAQLELRYSNEPALHPECAAYSIAACAVLNGSQAQYRHAGIPDRVGCNKPGCDCGGWVKNDHASMAGLPVGDWFAVWLPNYEVAVTDEGKVHGLAWRTFEPLRVRPVRREAVNVNA